MYTEKYSGTLKLSFWFAIVLFFMGLKIHAQSKEEVKLLRSQFAKSTESDSKRVELLLAMGRTILFKEGELKADLDSAISFNNQAWAISKILNYKPGIGKSILLEGQIYRERGDRKKSWETVSKAVAYFEKNNMPGLKAEGYTELGQHFGSDGKDLDNKIRYFELAIPLFKKGNVFKKQADALKDLGDFYQLKGDFEKSQRVLDQAFAIYKVIHFKDLQGIYSLYSSNYRTKGNFQLALKYALMAAKTAEDIGDGSLQLGTIYNRLALAYYDLKNNDMATSYFQKSLDIALKYKDIPSINVLSVNLASLYYRKKKFTETLRIIKMIAHDYPPKDPGNKLRLTYMFVVSYTMLKQYDKAKIYYDQILIDYKNLKENDPGTDFILAAIITYLQQTGQSEKTYPYLEVLKKYCIATNNLIRLSELEGMYVKSDSAQGKYLDAMVHFKHYKILSDSIFNIDRTKQFAALQIQFDTEKKDRNIKLLEQQAQLQKTRIEKDTVTRYVFIGSLVVLILFLGLVYNRYRLKQRTNKKLEIKQEQINEQNELLRKLLTEKEWLLKEIHHRVKNNLQIVISLLNTQSAYLDNEDALLAIQNSQHRMHAMSLIHQKLYQSENLASIDISWYIQELVGYLRDCFDTDKRISYKLDTEPIELDVAQAVPLGLILNEAISNAIKYAFPEKAKGQVMITLKKINDKTCQLIIADNGIGLPDDFEAENRDSLGMNLMIGLSSQLDGTFDIQNNNGLTVTITFTKSQQLMDADDHPK